METAADKYCFHHDKENNERSKQHAIVTDIAIDTVVMETKGDE